MPYSIPLNQRVQLRRDTSVNWTSGNPVLKSGEIGYETDTGKLKIGDNATYWTSLDYSFTAASLLSEVNLVDNLVDLGDVAISSASNGDFLRWNGTAWINDAVNLSTDTVGSFVQSLVAGVGITLSNNSGEGATPTVAVDTTAIQARVADVSDTEIGYLNGVTSAIQTQFDAKAPTASPTFSGTVTLPAGTVTSTMLATDSVTTAKIAAGSVTYAKLAADAKPKTYVTKYTDAVNDTEWTCPAGVTQIKLTLIGAGGIAGNVEAITPNSSTSQSFSNTATESTTFVVGATTYTALGGKKGESVSVSGPIFVMSGTGYTQNSSSSSSSSGIGTDFSRYPGCGGAPAFCSAETYISMTNGTLTFDHTSRAKALGYRGQDGVIEVFQVTVVPATTYSFSIGAGAGYTGPNESYAGSNGAVIIEYVV